MRLCRHCGRRPVTRPRGLCWGCFYEPEVRALYPSTSKFGKRSREEGGELPAPFATDAMPGTLEKIAVLAERAALGVDLWHPDDARPCRRRRTRKKRLRLAG